MEWTVGRLIFRKEPSRRYLVVVCDLNRLATARSTSFEINERLEMGLYELRLGVIPYLIYVLRVEYCKISH